jgi:DNA-binding XRE family transcriptional regulator
MKAQPLELGRIIAPAKLRRAGTADYPVLSMALGILCCESRVLIFLSANYHLHILDKMVSLEKMISVLGDAEALEKFGIRLKALRLRRNVSQEYVAGVVGVSVPTYRKIEQGDGTVEFRHVARALGVFGLAEALGDVIPATEPELRLKDLLRPERKNASKPRRKS